MEIIRRYVAVHPTGLGAYLALQCDLMRLFVARGGSAEEFCQRLAPAFRRRYGPLFLDPATFRAAREVELARRTRLRLGHSSSAMPWRTDADLSCCDRAA